ncbi:MAG: hypothetical protein AABZ60_22170, partial [Planctomycetota bacterium]
RRGSVLQLRIQNSQESAPRLLSIVRDKAQTQAVTTKKKSIQDLLFSSETKPSLGSSALTTPIKANPSEKTSFSQIKKKTQKILNILREKEIDPTPSFPSETSSVPIDSLESRLSGLQEESLNESEQAEEIPEKEGFFKRIKKASQRLKKATQRLKQKTGKIIQTLFEHFEEKHHEEQEFQYYPITEQMPQSLDPDGITEDPNLSILEEEFIASSESASPVLQEIPEPQTEAPKEAPALMKIMYDENANKPAKTNLPSIPAPKKKTVSNIKPETQRSQKKAISISFSFSSLDKKTLFKILFLILLFVSFWYSLPTVPKQRAFTKHPTRIVPNTPIDTDTDNQNSPPDSKQETKKETSSSGD